MTEAIDTQRALQAVERLQAKLKARGHGPTEEKLSLLRALLLSPLFHQILTLQSTSAHEEAHSQEVALPTSSCCPELKPETSNSQVLSAGSSDSGPRDGCPAAAEDASVPPSPTQSSSDPSGDLPKPLFLHMTQGRYVTDVELLRSPSEGPGFAAVSLRSENRGDPGVLVPDVQLGSAESRKLRDILATNEHLTEQTVTQEKAGGLPQEQTDDVLLKVTRGPVPHLGSPAVLRMGSGHHGEEGALEKSDSEQAETTEPVKVKVIFPGGAADQVHDGEQLDTFDVELIKNAEGLGITVAGYVTEESTESLGIFVKSVTKDSKVEQDGQIHVGDQIIAVDGTSIQGYSNQQVTELLRATSQTVVLKLLKRSLRLEDGPAAPAALEPGPSTRVANGNQPSVHDVDLGGALEKKLRQSQTAAPSSNLAEDQAKPDAEGATLTMPAEDGNLESVLEHKAILGQEEAHCGSGRKSISFQPEGRRCCGASVMPEGPVGLTGEPCTEEKPPEVTGVPLLGESTEEGRDILKGLPASVSMVTSSPAKSGLSDSSADQCLAEEPSPDEEPDKLREGSGGDQDMGPDMHDITGAEVPVETPDSPLVTWETEIQYIDLERGDAGLGFSILDYQDPADLAKAVIVVRSLVPDGVADLDGRLYPGDRLVSVNGADLADAGLEEAVWALKGPPAGAVRLGITKPIFMDSNEADLMNEKTFDPHYSKEEDSFQASTLAEPGSTWRGGLDCQMPTRTSVPEYRINNEEEGRHTETADMEASDKRDVTATSDFQRTITVVRGNSSLGMTVSALKDGAGVVIRSIVHDGSVSQDGRLGVGDCIVAINEESTRSLSNAEGRALLRKHSLIGPEISLTYVPAEFLEAYRAGLAQGRAADSTDDASPVTREHVLEISEQEEGVGENSHQSDTAQLDWNQPRTVKLRREAGESLGISILGGRGMGRRLSNGGVMRGIFIKHVLEDSPAGRSGTLKPGDMILEVGGRDLRGASHKEAVEAIRRAGDPVVFLVQSVAQGAPKPPLPFLQSNPCPGPDPPSPGCTPAPPEPPAVDVSEEEEVDGLNPSYNRTESSIQCRPFFRISPAKTFSPAPFKLSAHRDVVKTPMPVHPLLELPQMPHVGETDTDMVQDVPERPPLPFTEFKEEENDFGYSWGTLAQRYGGLLGALHMVELELGTTGLGLTLAASRGCSTTGVFVESVDPYGAAGKDGHILAGDELLEINGQILYGCSHKNASTVIESAPSRVNIIFIRNMDAFDQMAVEAVKKCRDVLGAEPEEPDGLVTDAGEEDQASGVLIGSLPGEGRVTAGNLPGMVGGLPQPGVSTDDPDSLPSAPEPGRRVSDGLKALVSMAPDRGSGTPLGLTSDLRPRPIIPGCEATIAADLILSISGGCDTPSGVIVFQELSEEGAATKDGHLRPGDQILEVNSIDPRAVTRDEVVSVVSRTPRCDKAGCGEQDPWDVFTLDLAGEPGQELGLRIFGKRNDPGVFISEILQGGTTEADGRLTEGDRILSVNGEDVRAASQQYVTALLKCCSRPISLQVARFKVRNIPTEGSQSLCSQNSVSDAVGYTIHRRSDFQGKLNSQWESDDYKRLSCFHPIQRGCKDQTASDDYLEIQTVSVFKEGRESPGVGTAGGTVGPLGDIPAFVTEVHPVVPGAESPALKVVRGSSSPEPAVAGLPDSGGALQNDLRPPPAQNCDEGQRLRWTGIGIFSSVPVNVKSGFSEGVTYKAEVWRSGCESSCKGSPPAVDTAEQCIPTQSSGTHRQSTV